MITTQTVLVLGAGASVTYGLPLGRALISEILHHLQRERGLELVEQCGVSIAQAEEFRWALAQSGQQSIDEFLEYRQEFINVGKLAISLALIPYESPARVLHDHSKLGELRWYELLFAAMRAPAERFSENRLAVVTFNYDRSLEYFLHTAVRHSYGLDVEQAADILTAIPIVHVHGQLGWLPWQSDTGTRSYEGRVAPDTIATAAEGLRVMHETQASAKAIRDARAHLHGAQRVIFLGFGYHDANLQRLHLRDLENVTCMGTSFGLGVAEMKRITSTWPIDLGSPEDRIVEYLREVVTLD